MFIFQNRCIVQRSLPLIALFKLHFPVYQLCFTSYSLIKFDESLLFFMASGNLVAQANWTKLLLLSCDQ